MNRYKIISPLGDHSYSSIFKAENTETHQIVAIKLMKKKFYTWQECMALREIKVLRVLQHPSIVRLKEVIRNKEELLLVYEYLDGNLFKYYQTLREKGKNLPESQIKQFMFQIISCVNYVHKMGYFHRDLTLENIYIDQDQMIKIGHFNNAKELNARPPLTDYVSTRWYRAPEQLLRANNYTYKIDIFALGCIMAELYLMGPLFCGASEIDQLAKICQILGTPSHKDWTEFFTLGQKLKIQLPECPPKFFSSIFPKASTEAIDLFGKMLVFNPQKRWNCNEILNHQYFAPLNGSNLLNSDRFLGILSSAIQKEKKEENFIGILPSVNSKEKKEEKIDEIIGKEKSTSIPFNLKGVKKDFSMNSKDQERNGN